MKCKKNQFPTVCEADDCRQKAELTLEFGFEPWHCIHLCKSCVEKLQNVLISAVSVKKRSKNDR